MRRAQPLLVIVAMSVAGLSAVVPAQAARPIARFTAFAVDMAEWTPKTRASYEQAATTPRPVPPFGSAPTITGLPW